MKREPLNPAKQARDVIRPLQAGNLLVEKVA
jgi:hypothetical protein